MGPCAHLVGALAADWVIEHSLALLDGVRGPVASGLSRFSEEALQHQ